MVRVSPTALLCVVCITQTCLSYHELLSLLWTVRQAGFSSSCADVFCMKVLMARCVTGCHGNTWVHYRGWTWFPAQNTFLGNSHEQVRQWLLWYVLLSEFCVCGLLFMKRETNTLSVLGLLRHLTEWTMPFFSHNSFLLLGDWLILFLAPSALHGIHFSQSESHFCTF